MRLDIVYIVGMLCRYPSNPRLDHWKVAKWVMRYLHIMKDFMLTYHRFDCLEVIGYSYSDFVRCLDSTKSTSIYVFILARGVISWKSFK